MIPSQATIERIEIELQAREAERTAFWQSGKFSARGLAYLQELIAHLPNTKSEALAALKKHGKADPNVTADNLELAGIGWTARPLAHVHETQRREIVEQAVARLAEVEDPQLLASARIVAASLPDYRSVYEARIQPLTAWAEKHADAITEEEHV